MARRRTRFGADEKEAGLYPSLMRGPGGNIPLPPKTPVPTYPNGGGTTSPGTKPPVKGDAGGKPGLTGGKGTKGSGSSSVNTYQQYLNAQKAATAKADRKNSNRYVDQAEALRGQANALLVLLGRRPGRSGLGYTTGPQGGGKGGGSKESSTTTIKTGGGQGGAQGGGGYGGGSGNGVKPGLGGGPGGGPGTGPGTNGHGGKPNPNFDPGTNMPRTSALGKWRGQEGTSGPGNVRDTGKDDKDKSKPGGWGDDWRDRYPGKGGGGGNGGGKDKDRGDRNLRDRGLGGELKTNLKNVERAMRTADEILMTGYGERVGALGKQVESNEKSANTQGFTAQTERGRQRANALSELMAQGAGESDVLRGQGMSLRSWAANQGEVNRAFHDSAESINASLTDLTTDTRSARVQNQQQAIDDKAQLWNSYFDAKSEALTQLGNTYGQMGDYYDQADDAKHGKKKARRAKRLTNKADKAFMDAAKVGSQSHRTQKVDGGLMDWQGAAPFEHALNNNVLQSAGPGQAIVRPEGANLRRWNAE